MNKWLVFAGILSALVSASPIDDSDVVEADENSMEPQSMVAGLDQLMAVIRSIVRAEVGSALKSSSRFYPQVPVTPYRVHRPFYPMAFSPYFQPYAGIKAYQAVVAPSYPQTAYLRQPFYPNMPEPSMQINEDLSDEEAIQKLEALRQYFNDGAPAEGRFLLGALLPSLSISSDRQTIALIRPNPSSAISAALSSLSSQVSVASSAFDNAVSAVSSSASSVASAASSAVSALISSGANLSLAQVTRTILVPGVSVVAG